MANITINEVSSNYTYSTGTGSFATVALPITSSWGPGYFDPRTYYNEELGDDASATEYMLEHTAWTRFPATQDGLELFVSTYRGAASGYRLAKDYSYQMALTLLTSGYDVLVCRLCPGSHARGDLTQYDADGNVLGTIHLRAKYPGTFGNTLQIAIRKMSYFNRSAGQASNYLNYYWNIITYSVDENGLKTSLENKSLVFNAENSDDSILYYKEIESKFWDITQVDGTIVESQDSLIPVAKDPVYQKNQNYVRLGTTDDTRGTDYDTTTPIENLDLTRIASPRFDWADGYTLKYEGDSNTYRYPEGISQLAENLDEDTKRLLYYREWLFTHLVGQNLVDSDGNEVGGVYDLLKDKLSYNPNRLISPGWDDQDFYMYSEDPAALVDYIGTKDETTCVLPVSPIHLKIMDVAYYSRCATGLIDVPHVVDRKYVHIEDETDMTREGYVQKLARVTPKNTMNDTNATLYHTHSAFFAPWGTYKYVGMSRFVDAPPSFLALLIQRAQILNQAAQYEWALPTNRSHSLNIGPMEYLVPKKLLDRWQKLDGASVNIITTIPDLGTNLWGNSTLYEVPPVTYQALANLSTRYAINAIEDVVYRTGISITFQYNNEQSYNRFYAGVTPILDTMKNVGAITDYAIRMSSDINGEDRVNANTVIGKIWVAFNGVINDITVDLIALPPNVDLSQYQ